MSILGTSILGTTVLGSLPITGDPFEPNISHTISLTHEVDDATLRREKSQNLNLSQTVTYTLRRLRPISDLQITQNVSVSKTRNISVSSTLNLTQQARRIHEITISQDLASLQSAIGQSSKNIPQTIELEEQLNLSLSAKRVLIQTLPLRQRLRISRKLPRSLISLLIPIQHVKLVRAYNKTIAQTIPLSHELVRSRYIIAVSQDIGITHDLDKIRVIAKNISQLLLPNQAISRNIIKNEDVTQIITFSQNRLIQFYDDSITVLNLQYTITNPNAFVNARIREQLPNDPTGLVFELYKTGIVLGQAYLVPRMPHLTSSNNYVILYTDTEAITLPAPLFGDSEAETGTLTLRKAMDGTVYTYVKSKNTRKLKYDFELERQKSLQLKQFINLTNSKVLTLSNWKGEIWKVKYLSNPFVFTKTKRWAPTGEAVSISLEFEGMRIN